MTIGICSLLILVMAAGAAEVPAPHPQVLNGAWNSVLHERPRLLGPRERLQSLAKAKPKAYEEIKGLRSLMAEGIVHAVEGIDPQRVQIHIGNAMKNVARGVTNIHQDTWIWLTDTALTFDLFHDAIPPASRAEMIEWLNGHLDQFTTDENAFHNSTLSKILCYLRVAYATWGENPRAGGFRDYALTKLYEGKVVPVLREFGDEGGFTECGWYARGSLWHLVQALELARRIEGYDGFQQAPRFFYNRLAYEMFQPYPGLWQYGAERYPVEGDGAYTYGGHNEYPRHLRTLLAQYFRGSEFARAVANQRRPGSNAEARMVDFLYEEEPDAPLDLTDFPRAWFAKGIGKVYARSDWSGDATWLRFECGDYWAGHQHFETGNFEIFRHEPLATESGEYIDYLSNHSVNWLIRTIAHNCLLVFMPGETWKNMRDGGRNAYANDGGQAKKWDWTVDTLTEWRAKRDQFERGNIVAFHDQPGFLYTAGDATAAYHPDKVKQWLREIVFLRPHTFVILDRVTSAQAGYAKTWVLHGMNEPVLEGKTVTFQNGKGRLIVESLLPESSRIAKIAGYTYGGRTFDEPRNAQTPLAPKWRIEIQPASANETDLFLQVLFTDEPEPVSLLREGGRTGARIGENEVRFDPEGGGTLRLAGKEFTLGRGTESGVRPWKPE